MLVDRLADPVDSWVVPDSIVSSINQDYLIVFVSGILTTKSRFETFKMEQKVNLLKD